MATVVAVTSDKNGVTQVVTPSGYATYTGNALTELREQQGSGKKLLRDGVAVDTHADGGIAWGRWTEGQHKSSTDDDAEDPSGNGSTRALHYFSFAGTPTLPVLTSFTSFGSTATTVTSAQGQLVSTGI
ncbi:MAG: hypothetical protein JWP29_1346, partial [Rhodoferax sp.]|nr:hypothetical protein [Rhodoferax sp.]